MDARGSRYLRGALIAAAVLLSLVALTAIVAVVRGSFGEPEARIVGSAAVLIVASALAAIGLEAHARRGTRAGLGAAALAAVAAALWLVTIWWQADEIPSALPRATTICTLLAGALVLHAALALWARRPRALILVATVLGYACAAELSLIILREDASTAEARGLAVGAIVLVLALVLIPILARLTRPAAGG